ncbi:TonB-dependent receptor [Sphingomonas oligophenolica]|uniref:TonB-dependent receptor n=1 Tax=Sphingomonas oligophenolica TaxID=301154 RepID=A0ABU9Y699_9SPHN
MILKKQAFGAYLLASTSMLLIAPGMAHAQVAATADANADKDATGAPPADTTAQASESTGEIIVTGSRLQHSGFDTPTPVTVIGAKDLAQRGATSISQVLQQLPSVTASATAQSTGLLSGGGSGNYLNLRSLGTARTLVLIDGQRMVPTYSSSANLSGAVNLNVIPSIAIGRVDIVTGGASAAYGSDAVAGVANIIFDREFKGFKADLQYGISQRGDRPDYKIGLMVGQDFADHRGHFVIAGEWERSGGIANQGARAWGRKGYMIYPNPANTSSTDGIPALITRANVRIAATYGGLITSATQNGVSASTLGNSTSPLSHIQFGDGGTPIAFVDGTEAGPSYRVGGDGVKATQIAPITVPQDRKDVLAAADYKITDNITAFGDFLFSDSRGSWAIQPWFNALGTDLTISSGNPFIPTSIQQTMTANNITAFKLGRINQDFGSVHVDNTSTTYRIVGGLKGTLGDTSWKWDVAGYYSKLDYSTLGLGNINLTNYALAVDAVRDPASGKTVCRATLNAASLPAPLQALAKACVPINVFGNGSPSAAALAYIKGTSEYISTNTMSGGTANIRGDLFSLWSKPVSLALGGEYRRERLDSDADPVMQQLGWAVMNTSGVHAGLEVKEGYAEINAPIVDSKPFLKSLEVNGAFRYTDYSTSGSSNTWKLGAIWEPVSSLRLRGTVSRDIRAPNLRELFSGAQITNFSPNDPCNAVNQAASATTAANCRAAGLPANFVSTVGNALTVTLGNTALRPEIADTKTFGAVFSPKFLPGFRMSVDWYDINIKNAIGAIGTSQNILDFCYKQSRPVCGYINRDANGQLISVNNVNINGSIETEKGVDFDILYGFDLNVLSTHGRLTTHILASYVYSDLRSPDGVTFIQRAGDLVGRPKWTGNATISYDTDKFGFSILERLIGKAHIDNTFTSIENIDNNNMPTMLYTDINLRYAVTNGGRIELYGGVHNLLDKDPPVDPVQFIYSYGTNLTFYDVVGRSFYIGARVKF